MYYKEGMMLAPHHPWPCGLSKLSYGTYVCHSEDERYKMSVLDDFL